MEGAAMNIVQMYNTFRFALSTRHNIKRNERLRREADGRIQVREFNGRLCICLDHVPLLPLQDYSSITLKTARETFYEYLKRTR